MVCIEKVVGKMVNGYFTKNEICFSYIINHSYLT